MILVTGARGALGSRLVRRLLAAGESVRFITRDPDNAPELARLGAEPVRGDLLDTGWQDTALSGVETLVIASHGLYPPSRRNHPVAVDGTGTQRLIDAAARANISRVIYVSAAGAERGGPAFLRIKRATERYLQASALPWTIIRPTVFIENNGLLVLGEPLRGGEPVKFIGSGTTPVNWVSADDVAATMARVLNDPASIGRIFEVRGPDTLSRVELLALLEELLDRKARRQHLPRPVAQLFRAFAKPFNPGLACLLELALADAGPPSRPADAEVVVGPTGVAEVVATWARTIQ